VTVNEEQATSFGNVAGHYDRVRPGPPGPALDWLVPAGCQDAVDLAAGTGLFTRALRVLAARIVAVEPDERMRQVLAERSPGVDVRAGWGEAIPLPDASTDAVFVSTAWHWLDPARAVPEIARVLKPGGRLGVIWTSRDRDEDWVAELDLLRAPGAYQAGTGSGEPRTAAEVRARLDRHHTVTLPAGAAFRGQEAASFRFTRTISVDDVLDWLATSSEVITAPAADRAATLDRCRTALAARADGAGILEMPMRSWCWRAQRWLPSGTGNNEKQSAVGWQVNVSPTISVWERSTAEHTVMGRGIRHSRRVRAARTTRDRRLTGPTTRNLPGRSAWDTASG
jgi:SAM-dependent methyltransferase